MRQFTKIVISLVFAGWVIACGKSDDEITLDPNLEIPENPVTPNYLNVSLVTDKAAYVPGSIVVFTIDNSKLPGSAQVRYKYLDEIIDETSISGSSWNWQTPTIDFRGYAVEVYSRSGEVETIYATVGVDVSSDWTRFPRYGFLSRFSQLTDAQMDAVIDNLAKYHINGLQFYDWQNKHHMPLPVEQGVPAGSWKDIINRDISFSTVESYIEKAKSRNIKTMFYNLVYGAWGEAEADGVQKEWYVFTDNGHRNRDFHPLSSPFLSNIYLLDPSNTDWQQYIADENQTVYQFLDFDGYHMDQLGDRGTRYKYDGSVLDLSQTYKPFIEAMKAGQPSKNIVMNAVNQYGQKGIAQSSADFLYTEVWSPNDTYNDLSYIIQQNNTYSNNTKNTVLAAYMNYNLANNQGYFNTPAVLMTDAVIFAFGGSHLELGEHMLGKEYFPNSNLQMKADLMAALPDYYDFLVAYQNLLRDGGIFNMATVTSVDGKMNIANWPASQGEVATVCKKVDNRQVVHLINFTDSKSQQWRDNDGNQASPTLIKDAPLSVASAQTVKKVWVASPDIIGGASRALDFSQSNDRVVFTLPELKYWTTIVLEFE